jgi:hypothetical protein
MEPGHSTNIIRKQIILLNHLRCLRPIELILCPLYLISRIDLHSNIQVENICEFGGILSDTFLFCEEIDAVNISEVAVAEFSFPGFVDHFEQQF